MLFVEGKLALTMEEKLFLIFEGVEENYGKWLEYAQTDWSGALDAFVAQLKQGKPSRKKLALLRQADGIRSGDRQFFHAGAKDESEAAQFLISNTIMAGSFPNLKAAPPPEGRKSKKSYPGGLGDVAPPVPEVGLEEGY